jgi:hypothetical protein
VKTKTNRKLREFSLKIPWYDELHINNFGNVLLINVTYIIYDKFREIIFSITCVIIFAI